jgi:Tfp pilus assembly protein PilF
LHVARQLAPLYDRLGDTPHALAEYQRALKENPDDADVLNGLGYFYYSRGQWPEAEETLRRALGVNPRHARAWVNLGLTLGAQGQCAESLDAFRKVVSEAEAHSNLAFLLMTQGKREEAKKEYCRALELDPNLAIARQALDKLEHPGAPASGRPDPRTARQPAGRAAGPAPDLSPVRVETPAAKGE